MPNTLSHVPKYCRHKPSGQACVYIDGRMIYLGIYGSAASREEYNRLIAEWLAAGRKLPTDANATTINEIVAAFRQHAKRYYTSADGEVSTEVDNYDQAVRPLVKLYGRTPAGEFGPLRLKALREVMIANGHVRSNIVIQNR